MAGLVAGMHAFDTLKKQDVDARDIGEPSGLAFGKPKDRLRDAVFDGYARA
jgi:hypothetical protein